ncbi:MAG: RNA polymerase sigma factor [Paraglaciecola sp.]|uniref:RNA polymerase sigma factor n=1 Tax=Pseudomonadati TaxID=3379134 RepID=UPI00273F2BAC|nr:RNA polymerase sigma factor [Paraglaciecola sp.]MDP5032460.1 RNA polymerase sigma factor [Paraglaciecola sp.]MDP5130634.1 RNA polymerase sigma factor [Paraglaciecola sp.]
MSNLEATYLRCRTQLERMIGRIVKRDDIEDIVQETFIKSYEAELQNEITFERTYMFRTARNLALNHVSRASEKHNQSLDDVETLPSSLTSQSLEKQIESKQRFLDFYRATDNLSPEVKRVFLMKKVYGMSQKDIAQHCSLSESTVEKHVAKGLLQCSLYLQSLNEPTKQQTGTETTKKMPQYLRRSK